MMIDTRNIGELSAKRKAFLSYKGQPQNLLRAFWIGVTGLALVIGFTSRPIYFESLLGSILIAVSALIPLFFWCSKRVLGVPIYPVYALTFLWTFALPLASEHPKVALYSANAHMSAALIIAGCSLLGTISWLITSKYYAAVPTSVRTLDAGSGETFFFCILAINDLFTMAALAGWVQVDAGLFSLIRATLNGLEALAVFVLAHQWGKGELSKKKVKLLAGLILLALVTNASSLLLVASFSTFLLVTVAYVLGRGRIPWVTLSVVLVCLVTLHYGKGAMREKYWYGKEDQAPVQPWQYPALIAEWSSYSLGYLLNSEPKEEDNRQSFFERASLIHLFLLVQDNSPKDIPYLMGSTYSIIPELLVPRFLMPDKAASHEGTYLLNIQYGLQTREQTAQTTIGWGLFNESYANFGIAGCALLSILFGAIYGTISCWSLNSPILSSRFLFAILVISVAFQAEFSASVYLTSLFQSIVPLLVLALVFMKPQSVKLATASK